MSIITPSQFIDKYELSTGMYASPKIEAYILKYEERYLVHLFGAKLYNEFISDLAANTPQSPNFLKVFEPFNEDLDGFPFLYNGGYYDCHNRILESDGIIEMLLGFIYFEYAKDLMNQQTPYGNVKQRAENSVVVDSPHSMMYGRYNTAIGTYRAIQSYLVRNTDLPLGQIVTLSIDNPGATYVDGVYDLIGGSGEGAKVTITTLAGVIDTVAIVQDSQGLQYEAGDILTVDGGDNLGTVKVDYVGVGDYDKFNGVMKGTAYWI